MNIINNSKFFNNFGYCLFRSKSLKKKIKICKKIFLRDYVNNFAHLKREAKLSLIKKFSGEPSVVDIFYSKDLHKFLKKLEIDHIVQTGPIVTHYSSNNSISKSFGLPFHQDFPSMCTSLNGLIVWFNFNNQGKRKNLGIEVSTINQKKLIKGKISKKGTYEISEKDLLNEKFQTFFLNNDLLIMSSFTPHRTFIRNKMNKSDWRLGLSTRFDDLNCKFWKNNEFKSAYSNFVDRKLYLSLKKKL